MTNLMQKYHRMPKNFMTPNIIKVEQYEDRIIELSSGFGFDNKPIWGVSEFKTADTRFGLDSTDRGEMFNNPKEAKKYYSLLKLNYI